MELFGPILAAGGGFLGYALPFLFVLTVVVFFHELGHFLVARWAGVRVETFAIGFGPEIVGRNDAKGTRWKLCWIPLGGYVKFAGDDSVASTPDNEAMARMDAAERAQSFHAKPLAARAAIVAAGPIANFILAIVIFAAMFATVGQFVTPPRADVVQEGSAAEQAGIRPGDLILSIDGRAIDSFSALQRIVTVSAGRTLEIEIDRGGERLVVLATPTLREITDRFGSTHRIGLLGVSREAGSGGELIRHDPLSALALGVGETWFVVERTGRYLYGVIVGSEAADQLGGPIRIAQVSGEVAQIGILALINLTAVLSISIGLLNLMPIPLLDGGHLAFYAAEALRGRPLSARAQEIGFRIGLALVLMLMLFATWNDLVHLKLL